MSERKLRLSQCMIVKNEEENIKKALSWGKGVVCEQIVVDTGSSDQTVSLAEGLGAKVFYFPWIHDFSAAKNFALEQVSGDWIAFLDADEYIKEEDADKVLPLLARADEAGCLAVRMEMLCIDAAGTVSSITRQIRFFKRLPELKYYGAVHEHLLLSEAEMPERQLMHDEGTLRIYHTGYDPEVMKAKKKSKRNLDILLEELKKQPENYHIMGDLGDVYVLIESEQQDGEAVKEAEHWYREAVRRIPRTRAAQNDRNVKSFLMLMNLLYQKKDEAGLTELYKEVSARFTGAYDADYLLGKFYAEEGADPQKGIFYLERAIQILEKYGTECYGAMLLGDLPGAWERIAGCYYKMGDLKNCVVRCVNLLKADKSRQEALELLLRAFSAEKPESIVGFLSKLYDFKAAGDRALLEKACSRAGAFRVLELVLAAG